MNRQEAIASGAKRYTGKTCAKHRECLGLRWLANATCVGCDAAVSAVYRAEHPEKMAAYKRKWSTRNKDALNDKARAFRNEPQTRHRYLARMKDYRRRRRAAEVARSRRRRLDPAYRAQQLIQKRRWRTQNRDRHLATSRAYDARQMLENMQRRISKNLRNRIGKALIGKTRGVSAVRDLGISIQQFREYIAAQFETGMTWDNYGEWHIDHKIPLIAFDLTNNDQARRACHFSNLQPLWASANQSKHSKIFPSQAFVIVGG